MLAQSTESKKETNTEAQPAPRKANKGLIGHSVDTAKESIYGMAGCGLGSILFGESDQRMGQVLAATTNGVYGNQTFGMSSGTSNCVPEKATTTAGVKKNMELFVVANREAMANDIVKSNGETIVAMSNIMGCSDKDYLGAKLQNRYEAIFESQESHQVASNVVDTVLTDRYLYENCKF